MAKYLIEISLDQNSHPMEQIEKARRLMGSHFVTHANWRQENDSCTASMIAEVKDGRTALAMVPTFMRPKANIFELAAVG